MLPQQFSSKVCVLRSWYFKYGSFPSQDQTTQILWFKSQQHAQTFFNLLVAWEFVHDTETGRAPTDKMTWVPLISDQTVPAWFPTPGRDDDQYVSFDLTKQLIPDINATTILTVSGESMIEAWIFPGDRVIVHQLWVIKEGSLIVAIIDGWYTLKYYHRDANNQVYLQAANQSLFPNPIYPEESLEVFGVVTWMFREFS
jgi:SOS-response transcriptional repressor LexA